MLHSGLRWAREKVKQLFDRGSSLRHQHLCVYWSALVQLGRRYAKQVEVVTRVSSRRIRISLRGDSLEVGERDLFSVHSLFSDSNMQSCAKSWGIIFAKSVNPHAPCKQLTGKSCIVGKLQSRIRIRDASVTVRSLRTSAVFSSRQIERIFPRHDDFAERHIGPGEREKREMLDALGVEVRFWLLSFCRNYIVRNKCRRLTKLLSCCQHKLQLYCMNVYISLIIICFSALLLM